MWTVAVSDFFTALGNIVAAQILLSKAESGAIGCTMVAAAATLGVLRFGVSDSTFIHAHSELTHLATFVGTPLIGVESLRFLGVLPLSITTAQIVAALTVLFVVVRSNTTKGAFNALSTAMVLVFFVVPVLMHGVRAQETMLVAHIVLYVIVGAVVGADFNKTIFGVRHVNLFHYVLAVTTYGIAKDLVRIL
jgi:hypothetical protein